LNVSSGTQRIRIEHGHLYDPLFVKWPRAYELLTWFWGLFLKVSPRLYRVWMWVERVRSKVQRALGGRTALAGEKPEFAEAALEIARRGFDTVVFGHTHHAGEVDLGRGRRYLNPGSWLLASNYIEIHEGAVAIRRWAG
jgi:UDP-2,3-diacylglucosamine pyrophosphatase LpxH